MTTAVEVATYFQHIFRIKFNKDIDEMRLHKLLYFAQRQSLVEKEQPLFADVFEAWKFGPVVLSVRKEFKEGTLFSRECPQFGGEIKSILDYVFDTFASKSSWTLSNLSHRELSWRNARIGIPAGENGNNPMLLVDIKKDAERYRYFLVQEGLKQIRKELENADTSN